jgi:hypothetical protein
VTSHGTQLPPPLREIINALRDIVSPKTFSIHDMKAFLDLLAMIEWYRLDYTKRVSDTLTWNLYYNTHLDPDVLTLRTEEENIFANIMRVQTGLREVFMVIISRCCLIVSRRSNPVEQL